MACSRRLTPDEVYAYAIKYNAPDPYLAVAQAEVESGFCVDAVSFAGACGIMQFLPTTASETAGSPVTCETLFNPAISIALYSRHIRYLLSLTGGSKEDALAAYVAGPGILSRKGNYPGDVKNYIERVMSKYAKYTGKSFSVTNQQQTGTTQTFPKFRFNLDFRFPTIPKNIMTDVLVIGFIVIMILIAYKTSFKGA